MKLTDRGIRALKSRERPYLASDGDGLFLRVQPGGGRSWIVRLYRGGKPRDMGVGPYPEMTLAAARDAALEARRAAMRGDDPISSRQRVRAVPTFREAAEAYIETNCAGWRNAKHGAQWSATLTTYAYPSIGTMKVNAIETADVLKVLGPIWAGKSETAGRVRGRIEAVLDRAKALGQRTGENPAAWKGNLAAILPPKGRVAPVEHHPSLPYAELADFMVELRSKDGMAARALEFAILTAARTGEVIGATWSEIDLEGRVWTVPGSRMKAGREHRVPLSDAATLILAALPGDRSGRVFRHRGRALSNMSMLMLLRRMGRSDLTVHGFRSTFSDWCAEQTNTPSEVREMALAHAVGDKVEAAYRRGDLFEKRRSLANAWAAYCSGEGHDEKVVRFRSAG